VSPLLSHLAATAGGILATLAVLGPRLRNLARALAAAEHRATHDPLTGLANRRGAIPHLRDALRRTTHVGVILLDLDNFKTVNDTPGVGHHGGDLLLRQVATLLQALPPPARFAARLGGDEFVVVVDGDDHDTAEVAGDIWQLVTAGPFVVAGHTVGLGVSVGHASSRPGLTARKLLHHADLAMYEAKRAGGGISAYQPSTVDPELVDRPDRRRRDHRQRPETHDPQPPTA
jgi:diguanylate cyclase (GGDEF)-like protein